MYSTFRYSSGNILGTSQRHSGTAFSGLRSTYGPGIHRPAPETSPGIPEERFNQRIYFFPLFKLKPKIIYIFLYRTFVVPKIIPSKF